MSRQTLTHSRQHRYTICIGCLTLKRLRGESLPRRPWSLGRWGLAVNMVALCWLVPVFIFTLFPGTVPVRPSSMNYRVLLFGAMVLFSIVYYLLIGRREYISPRERVKRDAK